MIDTLKAAFPTWAFAPNVMITARVTGWSGDITAHIDEPTHLRDEYTARVEIGTGVHYGHGKTPSDALCNALEHT